MRLSRSKMKLSSTTDQTDLPFVVVISGARNTNSQKDNISKVYGDLHNNQINARALIGQSAMVYCVGKRMEKSRVF